MNKLPSGLEDPEDFWKAICSPQEHAVIENDNEDSSDLEQSIDLILEPQDELILDFHNNNNNDNSQSNNEFMGDDFIIENDVIDDELNDPSFSIPYNDTYEYQTPKTKTRRRRRRGQGRFIYERVVTPTFSRENGIRRSKRKRTSPLEYWRNEKPHYAISPSTGTRIRIGSFKREKPSK